MERTPMRHLLTAPSMGYSRLLGATILALSHTYLSSPRLTFFRMRCDVCHLELRLALLARSTPTAVCALEGS
jgi:hypothetical protein